jgi:hypothetical protein
MPWWPTGVGGDLFEAITSRCFMKAFSLQRLLDAAGCGRISLSGELAGYIVLLLADQAKTDTSVEMNATEVVLYDDGTVRFEGTQGGRVRGNLRDLLGEILNVSCSVPATLRRISRADSDRSDSLVRELETALIPVNRSAARRGLARLHRDVARLGAFELVTTRQSELNVSRSHLGGLPKVDAKRSVSNVQLNIPIVFEKADELAFSVDVEPVPSTDEVGDPISVVVLPSVVPSAPVPESTQAEIPDLQVPEKFDTRPALATVIDDFSITRVDAILAPRDETAAKEVTREPDECIQEPIRTTTLVMARVEPVPEQQTTLVLPKLENGPAANWPSIEGESADGIRTTTLVLAEVAPRACPTWLPGAKETLVGQGCWEPVEPSVALPLVRLKKREFSAQNTNSATSIQHETPRLFGESTVIVTDIEARDISDEVAQSEPIGVLEENDASDYPTYDAEAPNDSDIEARDISDEVAQSEPIGVLEENDASDYPTYDAEAPNDSDIEARDISDEVAQSEPIGVLEENDASDYPTYDAEAPNNGRFFVDEPDAFTCDELTVMPLGAYELSYVEDPTFAFIEPPVQLGFREVTPMRSTFYREPSSTKRAILSDPEALVSELTDGSFWEDPELCRGLRALAGLELTPQPQPVEILSVSTEEPPVKLRASSR